MVDYSVKERKEMLLNLCSIIDIVGINRPEIMLSLLNEDVLDFEDCLQMECAMRMNANYIVTRDLADFANSPVPAVLPDDFLKILG